MTPDDIFSKPPKVEIKRQPKPPRSKKKKPSYAQRREVGLPTPNKWKTYDEQSPEERQAIKSYVIRRITERRKESVRFRKWETRKTNSSKLIREGGPTKVCNNCGKLRGIYFFDKIKDPKKGKDTRRPYCALCRKKINAEAYQRRKDANKS